MRIEIIDKFAWICFFLVLQMNIFPLADLMFDFYVPVALEDLSHYLGVIGFIVAVAPKLGIYTIKDSNNKELNFDLINIKKEIK